MGDTSAQPLPPWQADSRAYTVPPLWNDFTPGPDKAAFVTWQREPAVREHSGFCSFRSPCVGRGGESRTGCFPLGLTSGPRLLSRPGAGSNPLLVLLVHSTNTGCELRLGQGTGSWLHTLSSNPGM